MTKAQFRQAGEEFGQRQRGSHPFRRAMDWLMKKAGYVRQEHYDAAMSLVLADQKTGLLTPTGGVFGIKYITSEVTRLENNIAIEDQSFVTVGFLDLDNFGLFNKKHGDATGDLVLIELAKALQQAARRTDIIVRKGGDEIVIFGITNGILGSMAFANKILDTVRNVEIHLPDGTTEKLTASIGYTRIRPSELKDIAEFTAGDINTVLGRIIDLADQGKRIAKEAGRNRCQYVPNLDIDEITGPPAPQTNAAARHIQATRDCAA